MLIKNFNLNKKFLVFSDFLYFYSINFIDKNFIKNMENNL